MTRSRIVGAVLVALAALAAPARAQETPGGGPLDREYRLVAGDRIEILVDEHEEYTQDYVVPTGGEVSFPPLGTLKLLDRSRRELEEELVRRFTQAGPGQLVDPRVFVMFKEYAPRRAFLIGAVTSEIELPVHKRYGILEVLAKAGASPASADYRAIRIMRRRNDGMDFTFEVNVEDVLNGDLRKNVVVMPDDVIVVPALKDLSQTEYVYVIGKVMKPGRYPFNPAREKLTLTKLISLAGDFHQFARESAIKILRKEGNRTIGLEVDFDDIIDLEIQDPELRPDDVVFVPESPF